LKCSSGTQSPSRVPFLEIGGYATHRYEQADGPERKRAVLLDALGSLKGSYDRWLNKLLTLQTTGLIKIKKDQENNVLFVAQSHITPIVSAKLHIPKYAELNVSADVKPIARSLISTDELRSLVTEVTWHKHLFALQTSVKDAFGTEGRRTWSSWWNPLSWLRKSRRDRQ
jgi:hypothetical protein